VWPPHREGPGTTAIGVTTHVVMTTTAAMTSPGIVLATAGAGCVILALATRTKRSLPLQSRQMPHPGAAPLPRRCVQHSGRLWFSAKMLNIRINASPSVPTAVTQRWCGASPFKG
jgi:hypothetical protein